MTDPAIHLRSVLLEKRSIGMMTDQLLTRIVQHPIGSTERGDRVSALDYLVAHQRHLKDLRRRRPSRAVQGSEAALGTQLVD